VERAIQNQENIRRFIPPVYMHEMGVACSILDAVQRERAFYPGQRVSKVGVRIGKFAGVDPESLRFCFNAIVASSEPAPVTLNLEDGKRGDELEIAYMELI
jgi:Zn finger protein HypA/HybF involved in hydrogenase expression